MDERGAHDSHTRTKPQLDGSREQLQPLFLRMRVGDAVSEFGGAAAERLVADGSRVLGTILNEWDPRKSSHTGYAHAYPYYRVTSARE